MLYPVEFITRVQPVARIQLDLPYVTDETTVKYRVLKNLRSGAAVYVAGDVIEVTRREAFVLRKRHPEYFEVIQ